MTIKQVFMNKENQWNAWYTLVYVVLTLGLLYILWEVNGSLPTSVSLFDFCLMALATFRLVRLFVYDRVTLFVRNYFSSQDIGARKTAGDLLNCPWCFGLWAGTAVVFFYYLTPLAWIGILILALSGIGTFIQILMNLVGWRAESLKYDTMAKRPAGIDEHGPKV